MPADLGGFLQHADAASREKLLQADGGGQPRRAAADDEYVVFHHVAFDVVAHEGTLGLSGTAEPTPRRIHVGPW